MKKNLNVALVGLSFGGAFVPIYKNHPYINELTLCDTNPDTLKTLADRYGIEKTCESLDEILADNEIDAVHLITPIPLHEEQTLKILNSGKHCACTVPMAITLEGIEKIIEAVKKNDKKYMMMETSLYTRNYLYAKEMLDSGKIGNIQFMRGAHYQDMEKWPDYWMGLPPMYYGTHAISPLVASAGSKIEKVVCFGSGTMREELHKNYGNPFPVETAIFGFKNGLKAEVTRTLFETCHEYTEAFSIYGSKSSFEWQQLEWEEPIIYEFAEKEWEWRGKQIETKHINPEDRKDLLPDEIKKFTVKNKMYDERNPQLTFDEGGGHGGSHPHLVHEFLCAIAEDRPSVINEKIAGNITAAGICAHKSAMNDGEPVEVPIYK